VSGLLRRTATIALLCLAVSGGSLFAATAATAASPTPKVTATTIAGFEADVATLTNAARKQNRCAPLRVDVRLGTAARGFSLDMAAFNYFSHTGRDGSNFVTRDKRTGYPSPGGENIAWGYRTPQAVMAAWLNSAGHRANILKCTYKALGVGLAYKSDGTPYWTQEFGFV
jgi:uncharacterized protein YkwD